MNLYYLIYCECPVSLSTEGLTSPQFFTRKAEVINTLWDFVSKRMSEADYWDEFIFDHCEALKATGFDSEKDDIATLTRMIEASYEDEPKLCISKISVIDWYFGFQRDDDEITAFYELAPVPVEAELKIIKEVA